MTTCDTSLTVTLYTLITAYNLQDGRKSQNERGWAVHGSPVRTTQSQYQYRAEYYKYSKN